MTVITKKYKDKDKNINDFRKSSTINSQDHDTKNTKLAYYRNEKRKHSLSYELDDWTKDDLEYLA